MSWNSLHFISVACPSWVAALPGLHQSLSLLPPGSSLKTLMLLPEGCGCWLTASCSLCCWSQSSEPGGPTNYPPLVFHLPKPNPLSLTIRVEWQMVGGCVTGHTRVRGYDVMIFPSSTHSHFTTGGYQVGQIQFALCKSKLAVPTHLLSLENNYCWTVPSSAFNEKIETAKHLKLSVLGMSRALPMHCCFFTEDADVSEHRMHPTFESFIFE